MSYTHAGPRTLVLCFDGTAEQYGNANTNVVKFYSLLKRNDTERQICYYQPGMGEYFNPGVVSPFLALGAKLLDYAVAWYLDAHVQDGYRFLMKNYHEGDKICLFGFSRGAYTARALAGMLYKVGLLPKDNDEEVQFAYNLYTRTDQTSITLSAGFKQTFSRDVTIEFIGVWDTVISVGLIMGRSLPFVDSNSAIKTFRHALSLDEHRARFRPNVYHRPTPNKKSASHDPEHASPVTQNGLDSRSGGNSEGQPPNGEQPTDVLEVWFAGCHSDIGGSSEPDSVHDSLSNITLRWMVRQVIESRCSILFDDGALSHESISPAIVDLQDNHDTALDKVDALQPLYDDLKMIPIWWLLEIIPLPYSYQDHDGTWRSTYGWNLGRGRKIYCPNINFHTTVKDRMDALNYQPKAIWKRGTEVYLH